MALWTLIVWLVVGAIAGFLARKIMGGTSPFGLIGDMILGLAGGVVGGYLMALAGLGNTTGGLIATIITAIIGASILIWSTRFIKKS
ncbi:GlsB/YeaQ/YmgE family stress response membrane protein [uncultured Cocleimonas sp.]|uniref:GlsB/YeaQ/YmgE family stress response membrane protein n=1 Tax=uncultured Cocleimonas sp. TaxID=1051587 RepID=UPI00263871BD|nr:GlsB/YeaQ/YmgE family stress response membrane protein [uncultured Cocleimonas sp.]